MAAKRNNVIVTPVCLPKRLIAVLDEQMQREGEYSRSALIRRACMEYLERRGHKEEIGRE